MDPLKIYNPVVYYTTLSLDRGESFYQVRVRFTSKSVTWGTRIL